MLFFFLGTFGINYEHKTVKATHKIQKEFKILLANK